MAIVKRPYLIAAFAALLLPSVLCAQAIMGTAGDGDLAVVFPTPASGLPAPAQTNVTGMPGDALPHGVTYYGSDNALIADFGNSRVFVVVISTTSVAATIDTTGDYSGEGTIAVAPSLQHALACGYSTTLAVIHAPFNAASTITSLTLPGSIASYQTQGIVYNAAGRAFFYHTTGISVLDPPYTTIAFTIPVFGNYNSAGDPLQSYGAIAITPDGSTLLTTRSDNTVQIWSAPFSVASTPATLTILGSHLFDGLMVTPDGSKAIIGDILEAVTVVSAPFSSGSSSEQIPLPVDFSGGPGFEDVGISADGQLAILTGNSSGAPACFIQAPFTAAGATVSAVTVNGSGRGAGSVRFLPPGLAPGLTIVKSAAATVPSGTQLTYTITYGNSGTAAATGVVVAETIPVGTSFVSATSGGTHAAGVVTWNIGTVNAGVNGQTVQFTVLVTASEGAVITNDTFSIAGDGIPAIPGPPITAVVTASRTAVPALGTVGTGLFLLLLAAAGVVCLRGSRIW